MSFLGNDVFDPRHLYYGGMYPKIKTLYAFDVNKKKCSDYYLIYLHVNFSIRNSSLACYRFDSRGGPIILANTK